jgi:mannose-1-phosphate guanylyltransferase
MNDARRTDHVWSVILSGGEGERLRPFVQRWLGRPKPKQYCSFVGKRSMFQHTIARANLISEPERTVTVISRHHLSEAILQLDDRNHRNVILQPLNRDTAAGVFLALSHVSVHNPSATIVIFPSDHFVFPEYRLLEAVRSAVRASNLFPEKVLLLGISPDHPEVDYGWIRRRNQLGWADEFRVDAVESFLEKPSLEVCKTAMKSGDLWNSMILISRAENLWKLGRQVFPDIISLFEIYKESIGSDHEKAVLDCIYQFMPSRNFSADCLQRFPTELAVIELYDILWSDWGRQERIVETLRRIGRMPSFGVLGLNSPERTFGQVKFSNG